MTAAFPGDHEAGLPVLGDARHRRALPARLLRLASDERLVDHVRAGSEPAFEALFDRHHRGVLAFCRHMLGSVEEAEDAVQHTFLAAYRALVGSDKPVTLRPWLYTIARNRCLTVLRGRPRQGGGELVEPPTEHLAASVERRHELRELLCDLVGLPEDQRAALVLSELGDMAHDEIADVLGCRRDKVKALVFQARSSLIASRAARETPCADIREQLANLRGGALRRNELRRHLNACPGCREFRAQVRAQRRDLALVLPVAPTVGLKSAVVGAALGGSAAGPAAVGSATLAAKVLVAAAIAGGGTVAIQAETSGGDRPEPRQQSGATPASHEAAVAPAGGREQAAPVRRSGTAAPAASAAPGRATADDPGKPVHAATPERGAKLEPPGHTKPDPPGRAKAQPPGHAKPDPSNQQPVAPGRGKADAPGLALKPDKAAKSPSGPANAPERAKAPKPLKAGTSEKAPKPLKPAKPVEAATPETPAAPAIAPTPEPDTAETSDTSAN